MNVKDRIAKLEGLLARVTQRTAQPRRDRAQAGAKDESPPAPAAETRPRQPAAEVKPSPPAKPAPPTPAEGRYAAPPVKVEPETVQAEIEVAHVAPPAESRERLVAAAPHLSMKDDGETDIESLPPVAPRTVDSPRAVTASAAEEAKRATMPDAPELEVSEEDLTEDGALADEALAEEALAAEAAEAAAEDDEPPTSSRRPIAVEPALADLAFGDQAPPAAPHTPPPESGKQVASPAVDLDFDGDFTGVRSRDDASPAAASAKKSERAVAPREETPPAKEAPLAADVTRAHAQVGPPAKFVGAVKEWKPGTLGDLLDATLAL